MAQKAASIGLNRNSKSTTIMPTGITNSGARRSISE